MRGLVPRLSRGVSIFDRVRRLPSGVRPSVRPSSHLVLPHTLDPLYDVTVHESTLSVSLSHEPTNSIEGQVQSRHERTPGVERSL